MEMIKSAPCFQKAPSKEGAFLAAPKPSTPKTAAKKHSKLNAWFSVIAEAASQACGRPAAFVAALSLIIIWAVTGPVFHYSEIWQIVINTVTTIITFLLVFLIQNSQNRETRAVQLKLDELIRSTVGAHNAIVNVEMLSDEELEQLYHRYQSLAEEMQRRVDDGGTDTDAPEVA